jgi:hypothetical protein
LACGFLSVPCCASLRPLRLNAFGSGAGKSKTLTAKIAKKGREGR